MDTDLEQADALLDAAVKALGEAAEGLGGARARLDDASRRADSRATRVARRVTITGDPEHDGLDLDSLISAPASTGGTPPQAPATGALAGGDGDAPKRSRIPQLPRGVRLVLGTALGLAGAAVITDQVLTWTWQEPISALKAHKAQTKLNGTLDEFSATMAAQDKRLEAAINSKKIDSAKALKLQQEHRTAAATIASRLKPGQPLGRLVIPKIHLSQAIVQGTQPAQLAVAVGHYTDTKLPGLSGSIGIAGHRTTHGAPFRHVDKLKIGDTISMKTSYGGTYVYKVIRKQIVSPSDAGVLRSGGSKKRLVLTACHPLYSAKQRIVITAQLDHGPSTKA